MDVKKIRKKLHLTQSELADLCGVSIRTVQNWENGGTIPTSMLRLLEKIEEEGEIISPIYTDTNTDADPEHIVPLLPISAIGGSLTGFDPSVSISDCERILSPINGADFAIEVYGDSMAPEYPSGARILIKRIDMEAFIEWGKVYVLATTNGTVIKEVFPHGEEAVECRSVNATYPPFFIRYKDIHAMYRVLMCMTLK